MKIKVKQADYDEVIQKISHGHKKPVKSSKILKRLIGAISEGELKKVNFSYHTYGLEKVPKDQPCLILMNHSSFIDLEICAKIFKDRPYHIVCTSDGFVGKEWLMRRIGCIPTQKFVRDLNLLKDMNYTLHSLQSSILMYPEASYTFDGTATPLPDSVAKLVRFLKVPVIMVRTFGAFQRDPLYNGLQLRDVDVSADASLILTKEEACTKSAAEIREILSQCFSFDHFAWQQENNIIIDEPFRADYLNRVLYKCPHCLTEGEMLGKGIHISCQKCGAKYELTETGFLKRTEGESAFTHVPDWYAWERECVREEIKNGSYGLETDVDIYMLVDTKAIYQVGNGTLIHNDHGFILDGCEGRLHYEKSAEASYSLYADYFWYELGDVICIGEPDRLYYCFPKGKGDIVAKTRLATEEMYHLSLNQ